MMEDDGGAYDEELNSRPTACYGRPTAGSAAEFWRLSFIYSYLCTDGNCSRKGLIRFISIPSSLPDITVQ